MTFLPQLRALAVERLGVTVEGLRALAALPALVHLELRSNNIGSKGAVALSEVLKVFVLILVPVAIGMLVRAGSPAFAARMDRPVRVASAVILAVLVLGILPSIGLPLLRPYQSERITAFLDPQGGSDAAYQAQREIALEQ